MLEKRKILSLLVAGTLMYAVFSNIFVFTPVFVRTTQGADVGETWDNTTTLNVSVVQAAPRINWYDFQWNNSGSWVSRRNAQIDVDATLEYRFIVNISSDQGWDDIDYINITCWHDNGSESTTYNQSNNTGGNRNMFLQYQNTTGTAVYSLLWPDDEVVVGNMSEIEKTDIAAAAVGETECHNITFAFTPGYFFRYAPGDGSWDNTTDVINDLWSWNFDINVSDHGENPNGTVDASNITMEYSNKTDEFGVFKYSEIVSVGWPHVTGLPGQNATGTNISVSLRTNGNYTLSVNVSNLSHSRSSNTWIENTSIWIRGGDLDSSTNLTIDDPKIYLYGNNTAYNSSETNGILKSANDVEFRCYLPLGTSYGEYTGTIYWRLVTQT